MEATFGRYYVVVDNDGVNADLYDGDGRSIWLNREDESREDWVKRWVIGSIHALDELPEDADGADASNMRDKQTLLDRMNQAARFRTERERCTTPAFIEAYEELRAFIRKHDLHRRDVTEEDDADFLFFAVIEALPREMDDDCVDHTISSAFAHRWFRQGACNWDGKWDQTLSWGDARRAIEAVLEFRGRGLCD